MNDGNSLGLYVKDSAGVIWFAVVRNKAGSLAGVTRFYSDVRCDVATLGTPAAGPLEPASGTGGDGGAAPVGAATDAKLQAVIDAIVTSDDDTQTLLTTAVTEADDTQALLTALDTSNSDDATQIKNAITSLDTAQATRLGDILAKIGTEGDETQISLGLLVSNISALTAKNLAESNETQGILTTIKSFLLSFGPEEVTADGTHTLPYTVPAGSKRVLISNTSGSTVLINGHTPIGINSYYSDEAGIFSSLPAIDLTGTGDVVVSTKTKA